MSVTRPPQAAAQAKTPTRPPAPPPSASGSSPSKPPTGAPPDDSKAPSPPPTEKPTLASKLTRPIFGGSKPPLPDSSGSQPPIPESEGTRPSTAKKGKRSRRSGDDKGFDFFLAVRVTLVVALAVAAYFLDRAERRHDAIRAEMNNVTSRINQIYYEADLLNAEITEIEDETMSRLQDNIILYRRLQKTLEIVVVNDLLDPDAELVSQGQQKIREYFQERGTTSIFEVNQARSAVGLSEGQKATTVVAKPKPRASGSTGSTGSAAVADSGFGSPESNDLGAGASEEDQLLASVHAAASQNQGVMQGIAGLAGQESQPPNPASLADTSGMDEDEAMLTELTATAELNQKQSARAGAVGDSGMAITAIISQLMAGVTESVLGSFGESDSSGTVKRSSGPAAPNWVSRSQRRRRAEVELSIFNEEEAAATAEDDVVEEGGIYTASQKRAIQAFIENVTVNGATATGAILNGKLVRIGEPVDSAAELILTGATAANVQFIDREGTVHVKEL